jgi:short-subunit dehydrogenase
MLKKIIAPVVLGGALLGGLAAPAVAGAATASTPATPHVSKAGVKGWVHAHRHELRTVGLDVSAKTIGITPQALQTDLKAGNSVAGVATQHGVNPQTVVSALVSAADTQINRAVTAGKLTSAQASQIEARVPALVTRAVDHTF